MRVNDSKTNWFSVIKVAKKPVAVKKTAKKAGVGKHYEKIAENKSMYGKRIKQLKVIINDLNYLSTGNTYREFIIDMSSALVHGRKITPKMELAITNIVKKYTEHLKKESVDLVIVMVPGLYPDEVLKTIKKMKIEADVAVLRDNQVEFI